MKLHEFIKLAVIVGVLSPVVVWAVLNLKDYKDIAGISASHEALGDIAYSEGDFGTAVAAYERARDSKDSFHLLVKQTGARLGLVGLYPERVTQNQAGLVDHDRKWLMVQDSSSLPTCTAVGGHLALLKGHLDKAEAAYRESLEMDADNLAAHYGLALLAGRTGEADKAAKELEIVLKAVPEHVEALVALGEIRSREEGKSAETIELYSRALTIREEAGSRLGLGLAYIAAGDVQKAEPELVRASQLSPRDHEPLQALGNLYLTIKAWPKAANVYSAALEIQRSEESVRGLAIALREQGRFADALQVLGPLVQSGEAGPGTLFVAAQCLEQGKNPGQARNLYSVVVDRIQKMGKQLPEKVAADLLKASNAALARLGKGQK